MALKLYYLTLRVDRHAILCGFVFQFEVAFFRKLSTNSAAEIRYTCTCTNPHYIHFLTSNFWRIDFGNLFLSYDVQKEKNRKKHHSPHGSQFCLFKIADIKRASDPRIWCVLLVGDYQILPGYNKWGIRRECSETLVHIPYVHWFVVQFVCSPNVV